jgi:colanic acid/amylovoran biosynthesis glycosyltransferase
VVASYCATFLKPEMLHIYRQITSLRRVRPVVIAQKLENKERFPFPDIHLISKPTFHFLRRIWFKQIADRPWQISPAEVRAIERVLNETKVQLLHIYFGHIAVLLRPLIRQRQKPSLVSFHGADVLVDMHKPASRRATEEMMSLVKRVLVRSESLRQAVINLGCAPEKIEVQRTGIPLADFPFRERSVLGNGQWRLLQAGRLIEKKGLKTTLRAFAQFRKEFPAEDRNSRNCNRSPANFRSSTLSIFQVSSRKKHCASFFILRIFSSIRAKPAGTEIRKASPIPCWKRWRADCRSLLLSMVESPKQSKTMLAVF